MQSVPVSPPPMTTTFLFAASIKSPEYLDVSPDHAPLETAAGSANSLVVGSEAVRALRRELRAERIARRELRGERIARRRTASGWR